MFILKKIYKLLILLRFKLWRKGLLNGIYASIELKNLLKDIDLETVIDVGSNKGQFIILIEQLFPSRMIYSFEPITETIDVQKKFFNYRKNIFFYNFALGSTTSTKEFFITNRIDSSSFFKINMSNIKNKYYEIQKKRNIQIKSLDEVIIDKEIIKPVLMKIDVQGYELEVLKGAESILKKTDYLLIEVSENEIYKNQPVSKEIIEYLNYRNFYILKQSHLSKISKTNFIQRDILFKRKLKNEN